MSLLCWFLDGRCLGPDTRRVLMTLAYVMQKLSHVETFVLVRTNLSRLDSVRFDCRD